MADATDRRAKEAWMFHQAAEAARAQARYVMTSKLVFQRAAEVAKLCQAALFQQYLLDFHSRRALTLIFYQAASSARIRTADICHANLKTTSKFIFYQAAEAAIIRSTIVLYQSLH